MFPGINPNTVSGSKRPSAPCIPVITTVTFTATGATVSISPPNHNGGAYIRSYLVVSNPGNLTGTLANPAGGNIQISSLTPKTNYNFLVYATNEINTSTPVTSVSVQTPADVPGVPVVTGVVVASLTSVTVSYTAPATDNGSTISSYRAISCAGDTGYNYSAAGGTITVSGLTSAQTYNFKVRATNSIGPGGCSAPSSNILMPILPGSITFNVTGPTSWVVPPGVTCVSIVAVGRGGNGRTGSGSGGGGGGALVYRNNIAVSAGQTYTIAAGTASAGSSVKLCNSFIILAAAGGAGALGPGGAGGVYSSANLYGGTGGGARGGAGGGGKTGGGGYGGAGGAGGYVGGGGGNGSGRYNNTSQVASAGNGGGGGGGRFCQCAGGGGGGVGIYGQGASGGPGGTGYGGGGGSGGSCGGVPTGSIASRRGGAGGAYGGGGGAGRGSYDVGAGGAVRIVWPGFGKPNRQFPSTCVGSP